MTKRKLATRLSTFLMMVILVLSLGGCAKKQVEPSSESEDYLDAYREYVQSVLDANYHGDYAKYMEITNAGEEQASSANKAYAVTLAQEMAELYAIELGKIPASVGDRLTDVAYQLYKDTKYSVGEVEKQGDNIYVTITIWPLQYLNDAAEPIASYVESFNERAKAGEFEKMSESEYENEYAEGLLTVLEENVKTTSYGNEKTYRLQIRYNEQTGISYIADDDLDAINQLVLAD